MPGCESLDKIGEDEYRMKMKMALASLSGNFDGKVRITEQSPPNSFKLMVEGSGKVGFMKGEGLLKFTPKDAGTEVSYEGDVQVGGTIAAVQPAQVVHWTIIRCQSFDKGRVNIRQRHYALCDIATKYTSGNFGEEPGSYCRSPSKHQSIGAGHSQASFGILY